MQGSQKTYDPDFVAMVGGQDVTKLMQHWRLEDVEDGISSLNFKLGNPDLKYSGHFKAENDMSIQFGYHQGEQSPTVTMKVKDKKEHYPTRQAPTIVLVGLDCTERLVGTTYAGNANTTDLPTLLKDIFKGHKVAADIKVKGPENLQGPIGIHNMSGHAGIRWIMDHTKCTEKQKGDGEASIKGQKEYDWGPSFSAGEVVNGDRSMQAQIDAAMAQLDDIRVTNRRNRAGSVTIVGYLELGGQARLQAKKCLTIEGVGPEASGKWYIKRLVQDWGVDSGYRTICNLIRPTLGKDGKAVQQPVVMYANIYEKDSAFVGCRKIDAESQATFEYGKGENVMNFWWGIKLQRGRGAGEIAKMKGIEINNFGQVRKTDIKKDGGYNAAMDAALSGSEGTDFGTGGY